MNALWCVAEWVWAYILRQVNARTFTQAWWKVPAAIRAITGNGVNVLAMGAFYVAPQMACDIADAYLANSLGSGSV